MCPYPSLVPEKNRKQTRRVKRERNAADANKRKENQIPDQLRSPLDCPWPCMVPCPGSKHLFYCNVCKRTVSCGKQGIRDVKIHNATNMHQDNAKGMRNQSTLFQVYAATQNNQDKVLSFFCLENDLINYCCNLPQLKKYNYTVQVGTV